MSNLADTSASATGTAASAAPSDMTPPDHERSVRFGLVLTQLGAARKEEVFPNGVRHMPRLLTLDELSEHRLRKRQLEELDARISAARRTWWNPFSWFRGPATRAHPTLINTTTTAPSSSKPSATASDSAAIAAATKMAHPKAAGGIHKPSEDALEAEPTHHETTADQMVLPDVTLDIRPLTDAEVAALPPAVAKSRQGLLEAEQHVHRMLDTIERTRMTYLRAAEVQACEDEIASVARCYAQAAQAKHREAALRCGAVVDKLMQCSHKLAAAHVKRHHQPSSQSH